VILRVLRISWRNLWRTPLRTTAIALGVAAGLILLALAISFTAGVHREVAAQPAPAAQLAAFAAVCDGASWAMAVIVFGFVGTVVFGAMLMAVIERQRELGVLGALGMRPGHIMLLVTAEASGLAVVGLGIAMLVGVPLLVWLIGNGIDVSAVAARLGAADPTLASVRRGAWTPAVFLRVMLALLVVSFLAGLYPAMRAVRIAPSARTGSEAP
jgi:ABC-type antimicrobial peptide transport system permease subunit